MMEIPMVYCYIRTLRGISLGAVHYYGKLICSCKEYRESDYEHELSHRLTQEEADVLNAKDASLLGMGNYEAGEESIRFNTEQELIQAAKDIWKKLYPEAVLLVLGDIGVAEPQRVLVGPPEIMKKINALVDQAEACGHWGDEKEMIKICDAWEKLVKGDPQESDGL